MAAMIVAAVLTVAPWTMHNYRQYGIFLPVSSISGTSLSLGNNECIGGEGLLVPFDGDGGCLPLDAKRYALLKEMPAQPFSYWNDRAYARRLRTTVRSQSVDDFSPLPPPAECWRGQEARANRLFCPGNWNGLSINVCRSLEGPQYPREGTPMGGRGKLFTARCDLCFG